MTAASLKRRWFQFSLRTLMVFVLLASILLSWHAIKLRKLNRNSDVAEAVKRLGGEASLGDPIGPVWA